MKEIKEVDFQKEVREHNGDVLVAFTAPWCQPCNRLKPVLEGMSAEGKDGIKYVSLSIEEAYIVANDLGVRSVPSMVLFSKGMVMGVLTGYAPKAEIRDWISKNKG